MATIAQALEAALKHHTAGNLDEAERIYGQILEHQPHADAWHLLGLVHYARKRYQQSVEHIDRAIALDANQAAFHNHRAEACLALSRLDQADAACRRAVALKPDYAIAHNTLGTIHDARGQAEQAEACFRQAVALKPDFSEAHFNLGLRLQTRGQLDQAASSYRQAITLKPDYPRALHNLGVLLHKETRYAEAIECLRRAVALQPDDAEAHCNLGSALVDHQRKNEAVESYRRALQIDPHMAEAHFNLAVLFQSLGQSQQAEDEYKNAIRDNPRSADAYNNLGSLYRIRGKLPEALECFQQALSFRPDFGEALNNLGNVFVMQGRRDEAKICYDQSLRMRPNYAQAHTNRALTRLAEGNFAEGWPEYEWRWKCKGFPPHGHVQPLWDGGSLGDRRLLVHAEQGFGDTLQFMRFVPLLDANRDQVVVEVRPSLVGLLQHSGFNVVAEGATLPHCDVRIPLLSLAGILGTTYDAIPNETPYVFADPNAIDKWRTRLADVEGFKVGIAWQGSPVHRTDRLRSFPLAMFAPLASLPGVRLISLQKNAGVEQIDAVAATWSMLDFKEQLTDFGETAALIHHLDLVITCDSAPAHLAGAMGARVWVAVPFAPDWRWHYDRQDSPWYPTMRLFRQPAMEDWTSVFDRITEAMGDAMREG